MKTYPLLRRSVGRKVCGWDDGKEQQKAWGEHIFEMQTWRRVRGLAGAVMCETQRHLVATMAHV